MVLVVILVTGRAAAPGSAGLAIGLALAVIHLVGIPLDGTSVNPARFIGPALFAGTDALSQLWLFVVPPLIGAALAAALAPSSTCPRSTTAGPQRTPIRRGRESPSSPPRGSPRSCYPVVGSHLPLPGSGGEIRQQQRKGTARTLS